EHSASDYPLSFAQDRIWFLNELEESPTNYNIVQALSITGQMDRDRFERAFLKLIARHESLRTTFQERQGQPRQIIHAPPATLNIEHRTIREPADIESLVSNRALLEEIKKEASLPFDLSKGPLIRLRWIDFQDDNPDHTSVLIISLHHIIADGWSMGVMVTDLQSLYDGDDGQESPALKDPRIQCADHAAWQREQHQSGRWQSHLNYWQETLSGVPRVMDFPFDRPRHLEATNAGSEVRFKCSKKTSMALKELSRKRGASLFMTLQTAFATFLNRITGQSDLVIGNPIANRGSRDVETLIGCFINLLPIRIQIAPNQTFFQLLDSVKESCLEAYDHQDAPFEVIINELGVERNLAIDPLVQVAFTFQNLSDEEFTASGAGFRLIHFPSKTAKFDLELEMFESDQALVGRLEFRKDLLNEDTVQHWVDCFEKLLETIALNPKGALHSYPLLSIDTETQIQRSLTGLEANDERESFIEKIDRIASKHPQRIAAQDSTGSITYQELIESSKRIAASLQSMGVGTDAVVALLIDRSTPYLAAMIGTLRAGAAFLPMDAAHPIARMKQVLVESKARVLLTGIENWEKGEEVFLAVGPAIQITPFSEANSCLSLHSHSQNFKPANAGDLAYIIYTSGSTGTPKGAMVEHGGMLNHLAAKIEDLGLTEADVISQNASQCFDISIWQFLTLLLVGGKIRIYEDDIAHDPSRLFIDIARDQITVLEIVPSVLRVFLNEVDRTQQRPPLPLLRWMIPTGEAFPMDQAKDWFSLYPNIPAVNAYGPSE
ncbi:MAG: AMP-binding protein, partial [Verrucomicrobia bacterium]|nr:AMP-binding protein [Verrucomicrobiota bacterium]